MPRVLYKEKIPFLNFIRSIATIQIVLFHYVCSVNLSNNYVLLWGREGVALFFMISGAGLVNKYYYNFKLKEFFMRRFIGIYLPFWICFFSLFVLNYFWNGFCFNPEGIPIKNIIYSIFAIDGLVEVYGIPTFYLIGEWYLGIQIIIYIVFPFFLLCFRKFPIISTVLPLIARIILSKVNFFEPLPVCFNPVTALSNFAIGAFVILIFKNKRIDVVKWYALIIALPLTIFGSVLGHKYNQQDIGEIFCEIGLLIIYVFLYTIIIKHEFLLQKFICKISYEIFLVHHVIIYSMAPVVNSNYSIKTLLYGAVIIIATIIVMACVLNRAKSIVDDLVRKGCVFINEKIINISSLL